ncbi:MAG TPA: hypothetical protein VFA68_17305 [Terriglobales bacterium]|nr:hypothetical protein [Terriglobales bacterium]
MDAIVILILLFFAVAFISYSRITRSEPISAIAQRGVAISKYVVALFVATFGSQALAVLLTAPVLLYIRFTHSPGAMDLFSALVDRPYFPFVFSSHVWEFLDVVVLIEIEEKLYREPVGVAVAFTQLAETLEWPKQGLLWACGHCGIIFRSRLKPFKRILRRQGKRPQLILSAAVRQL